MSSLFLDEKVFQFAHGNLNNIIISNGKETVNGQLQENLTFSVDADWENIFSISERFQGAKKFAALAGLDTGAFNAGIWTKKFYKGGSYLKINPKIRVTDWNADGTALDAAITLIDMCLPVYDGKLEQILRAKARAVSSKVKKDGITKSLWDGAKLAVKEVAEEVMDPGKSINDALDFLGREVLTNSPTEVSITISTFFGPKKFIIENVQTEFSKEMTEAGPLYVDINLSLSTPIVTTRGSSGLKSIVDKPRFIIVD